MKYISLNWTLALKFSIGKKKRMRDCRILMAHDCIGLNANSVSKPNLPLIIIKSYLYSVKISSPVISRDGLSVLHITWRLIFSFYKS